MKKPPREEGEKMGWDGLGRVNTNGHFYAILHTWKSPTHSIATSRRVKRNKGSGIFF
jgi:hypothetical protein